MNNSKRTRIDEMTDKNSNLHCDTPQLKKKTLDISNNYITAMSSSQFMNPNSPKVSLLSLLNQRSIGNNRTSQSYRKVFNEIIEDSFFVKNNIIEKNNINIVNSNNRICFGPIDCLEQEESANALSTIAIAFSPDGTTFATTHGDHTVKIFFFETNKLYRAFNGHPRTPWTVKYHPIDSNIVASGCLGYEVRIWDISRGICLNTIRYDSSIISLAFHPLGQFIAISSGPQLYTWDWRENVSIANGGYPIGKGPNPVRRLVVHSRNIRAVMFHPNGEYLFAAAPDPPRQPQAPFTPCRLYVFKFSDIFDITSGNHPLELSEFPALVPQIHLYSDGGLDISSGIIIYLAT
jgi:WD40 repeat protein